MKQFFTVGAALLMTTSMATAGNLDRSGQSIMAIFEDGNYAELSFGSIDPSLSGSGIGGVTGDISPSYTQYGIAYKTQISDQMSLALIYDQPFGADVDYDTGSAYILTDTNAQVESDGVTVLARYEINPSFSVHGGLRYVQVNGVYDRAAFGPVTAYDSTYSKDGGFGYVIGGAYERDDIAMRIAMTYSSEIDISLNGTSGDLTTTLPESINLDFQTGIAADTLLFGSLRWVAWDGFSLDDDDPFSGGSILSYDDDIYTYTIGVGRRITDALSASFAVGYEKSSGQPTGQLGPTDGFISYQIGAAYLMDNGVEVSGGVRYIDIGDATTEGIGGNFTNNDAVALGLKIAYSF